MTGLKVTLEHPLELDDGSYVRAVIVDPPLHDELKQQVKKIACSGEIHDLRFAAYSIVTGLGLEIIEELDIADIAQLDATLDQLIKREEDR